MILGASLQLPAPAPANGQLSVTHGEAPVSPRTKGQTDRHNLTCKNTFFFYINNIQKEKNRLPLLGKISFTSLGSLSISCVSYWNLSPTNSISHTPLSHSTDKRAFPCTAPSDHMRSKTKHKQLEITNITTTKPSCRAKRHPTLPLTPHPPPLALSKRPLYTPSTKEKPHANEVALHPLFILHLY